jgi:hypothetical protein
MIRLLPNWNGLSLIGNSKVISLTIFVPFIGYLILFNNELVSYFVLSSELVGTVNSSGSIGYETISRLYFLYYGLISLGISSIGFSFFCPVNVKDHKTEFGYINDELKILTPERVSSLVNEIKQNILPEGIEAISLERFIYEFNEAYDDALKNFKTGMDGNIDIQGIMNEQKSNEQKSYINILKLNWDYHNSSKLFTRIFLSFFYFIGFFLVLVPSVSIFWKVLVLNFTN